VRKLAECSVWAGLGWWGVLCGELKLAGNNGG